jgi:16S rRNA (cytosine1402-N4)-methyltransferase
MIKPILSAELPHYPVMLDEVIRICSPKNGGIFVDCTFGGGGYSKKILKFSKTKVIALDRDKFILDISKELQKKYPNRFYFHQKKI